MNSYDTTLLVGQYIASTGSLYNSSTYESGNMSQRLRLVLRTRSILDHSLFLELLNPFLTIP